MRILADGTAVKGDVWKFMGTPVKDYLPSPADGATGQAFGLTLSWSAPTGITQHEVYLGTDLAAVTKGDASVDLGKVSTASFITPRPPRFVDLLLARRCDQGR